MTTYTMTGPDGKDYSIDGPPGASQDDVAAQMHAAHSTLTAPAPAPHTSQALGFYQGAMKPIDNIATALDTAAKHLGMNVDTLSHALGLPTTDEAVKAHADYVAGKQKQGIEPGGIGKFAGEVAGSAPFLAGGPIAQGAELGALTTDAKDPIGVAGDAALGAVGGKLGDAALKGAARVIAPAVRPNVQKLLDEGVSLTPGQIAGGVVKRAEDAGTSVLGTGDMIKSAQRNSLETFNRAAINRALPAGQKLPDTVAVGHDAVAHAQDTLDAAYQKVLPSLTVTKDPRYISEMGNLRSLAQNLSPDGAKQVGTNLDILDAAFSPGAGKMSGETMKALDSDLGRLSRAYRSSSVGGERLVGQALQEAQSILRDTVQRSNPAAAKDLKEINRGYANLVRIESAASKAKDGIFTPSQLQTATRVMDSSVRKRASARGGALMQDLATAGRDVLPSSVPDSGTVTRAMLNMGVGGPIAYLEPNSLIANAAGMAAYSKPGVNALAAALTKRPQVAQGVANALARLKGPAGVTGAALVTGAGR